MFEICTKNQLFSEYNVGYTGMAFDGCYYYLATKGKKKIIKFDKNLQNLKNFSTDRIYTSLCYDKTGECFWATTNGIVLGLFKLNPDFQEIDKIQVDSSCSNFSGVSYCCVDDSLLVSMGEKILHIDKFFPHKVCEIGHYPGASITGVTSLYPYHLYHSINTFQRICIVATDGSLLEEFDPPDGHIIEQILYDGRQGEYDYFQILTSYQGCYPYLLEARIEKSVLGKLCPCHDGSESDCCSDDTCESESSSDCDCATSSKCIGKPHSPCSSCPPHPPCPSCHSCNDVLTSIALVETSIAHILNAEGEKIQKVIASTSCIAEILAVNQEVIRTIIYVTNLEQVLYSKLDALRDCYKRCFAPCKKESANGKCRDLNSEG